ncbi:MAG: SgcJ/EcaC family oxidoreductase [Stenomitos rutilans HA7619-LM2]|nr:SgcJ/EcaC family oxidoreductase [Stenomitos rutilans HA7619-LM2]
MNHYKQDILEIKAIMQSFADAWNTYGAMRLAELFTEDADCVNIAGRWWKGRTELKQGHANVFGSHLEKHSHEFS